MYSKTLTIIFCLLGSKSLLVHGEQAQENNLLAVPDTCVALREGRNCYADIALNWQQPEVGNYCLRDATSKHIMQCWLRQQSGQFNYAFDSVETIAFELINSDNGKIIATTQVQLQWVYQNRQKKRRWRLF
ncbi:MULTISPECIES: DUF3019 domain-containing protein [unclassified Pseudoalteromonas]|uniref:DUF3019 domain-containing protein n=1 Tax=unclassified Pseudoalteromonas TaxID=194690 RepID=UPI000B3D0FAF|nr:MULTISPECIES: DUF3019 domain-containing protein [unclassified Pseudoalteromonas]MDN3378123.1 DUF3019 domain-containing protein [Pseudoalteromonas sp. APC 3893]MDN3386888.1 DUF3019 domain-containing protein [Pseudoalteromonas sp. APC 4017]OUS74594.1 hypothetical protein B5G52_00925 [Pseudoalteromonas sp. A601]